MYQLLQPFSRTVASQPSLAALASPMILGAAYRWPPTSFCLGGFLSALFVFVFVCHFAEQFSWPNLGAPFSCARDVLECVALLAIECFAGLRFLNSFSAVWSAYGLSDYLLALGSHLSGSHEAC